jgi:hypothetical protein
MGERDVRVVALPGVPVAAAHPGGRDRDDDPVRRRVRVGYVDDSRRCPEGLDDDGTHRTP